MRQGRTALVECHAELPLAVQRPLRGPAGQAVVTLLTPAGALFDGDLVHLEVECGPCVDVTLATASATRLNRCDQGSIHFDLQVHVAQGATFRYLPHELIPFTGARYDQRIEVDLEPEARVCLLEVIAAGTTDAPFTYTQLGFSTNLRSQGVLQSRERITLTPRTAQQLGGHSHYGSLLVVPDILPSADCESLGLSRLPVSGVVVKMLGNSAQEVRSHLLRAVPAAAWLRMVLPA